MARQSEQKRWMYKGSNVRDGSRQVPSQVLLTYALLYTIDGVTRSEKEAALGCDTRCLVCSSIPYTLQQQFIFADVDPPSYHVPSSGCVANDDNSIQQTSSCSAFAVSHATCVGRCSSRRANSRFSGMFFRSSLFILRIWNYSFCSQLSHLASQHHTSEYNKLKFGPGGRCY